MNKAILFAILSAAGHNAFADWREIGNINNDTVYIDASTIRRNENTVRLWFLHSYAEAKMVDGKKYFSEKRLNEFDCNTEEIRSHAHFFFSESMGNGDNILSRREASRWKLVEPASADYAGMELACSRLYEFKSFSKRFINRIINLE